MKTCFKEECNSPVFSNGYCKIHQYLRDDNKYLEIKQQLLSKKKIIPKRYKKYPVEYEEENNTSVGCNTEAQRHDLLLGGMKYQKALKAVLDTQNVLKRSPLKKKIKKAVHVEIYMKYFGYCKDDIILCEYCNNKAVDIHHIRGRIDKHANDIGNLVALCRDCHTNCHNNKGFNETIWDYHFTNVVRYNFNNGI